MIKRKTTVIIVIMILYVIFNIKTINCQHNLTEILINLKEKICNELLELMQKEDMINSFGRSKINPYIISNFYYDKIINREFIMQFLDTINFRSLVMNNNPEEWKSIIYTKFLDYIQVEQKLYESHFMLRHMDSIINKIIYRINSIKTICLYTQKEERIIIKILSYLTLKLFVNVINYSKKTITKKITYLNNLDKIIKLYEKIKQIIIAIIITGWF